MQLRSKATVARAESPAQDAARYGKRLMEISESLATAPGEDAAQARALLKTAADAADEAARLLENVRPAKLRLHVNVTNQPSLMAEAARYLLERNPGESPVVMHTGASRRNLPFAIQPSARLIAQLRALLSDDAVWTEARK